MAAKKKSIWDALKERASQVYDQVNPFDNNLTYQQRTPTASKSFGQQVGQVGGQTARTLAGNTARFINTANLGARQVADTAKMTVANLTHNPVAFRNANQASQQDYNRFTTQGGVLNTGTFFQSPQEAASGEFKTAARRIGGGTLGTAAEVVPFARGASLVRAGGRVLPNVARGAAEGAGYGAAGGTANELVQGQGRASINNIIRSAALGAGMGAGGVAAGAAVRGATNLARSGAEHYQALTPEQRQTGAVGGDVRQAAKAKDVPTTVQTAAQPTVKTRGFTRSVRTSNEVSPEVQGQVQGVYEPRSTAELAASSQKFAQKGMKGIVQDINDRLAAPVGRIDDKTVGDAIAVAKRLDAKGEFDAASNIYDKLAEHGTKLGQNVQAFALLSNRSPEGVMFKALRDLKRAGVEVTSEMQKQLSDLKTAIAKTAPGTEERDIATHNMLQYVSGHFKSGVGSKIVNVWRAGLLTSPITTAGNLLSNTAQAATRTAVVNPMAAAADKLFSLFTTKRTKTLTTRGLAGGAGEGVVRGGKYLKTGFDKRNPAEKYDIKQVNYGNGPAGKLFKHYTNAVYRWMGAQDQPFYYSAKRNSLFDQGLAEAKNRGMSGAQAQSYAKEFVNNPPLRAAKQAEHDAEYSVFQNQTKLGEAANHIRRLGPLGEFLIPFTRVPAAVAMRVLDNTPLGIAKEVVSQISKGKFDQRAMSQAIGNGMVGPALIGAGYALYKAGELTLGYPTDRNEQELWKMEGKQPYSVKVGDQWISLNYLQPFGTVMAVGGQFNQSRKEGGSVGKSVSEAAGTAGQSLINQSFLKGVAGALGALSDPQRYGESFTESLAGSAVPNIVRTAARATDNTQREVNGPVEAIKAGIPGLRNDLNPKLDAFGRPLPAQSSTTDQLFNPLRPSQVKSGDSVVNELRRLQDAGRGVLPSELDKTGLGKDKVLTNDQLNEMKQKIGPEVYAAWEKVMQDSRYQNMNDEDKMNALRKASETITEARKLEYGVDKGVLGASDLKDSAGRSKLNTDQKRLLKGDIVDFLAQTRNLTPAERYQQALDSYNADKSGMSTSDKFKAENNLAKLKVGVNFDDDTVNVYGLSQDKIADYLEQNPSDELVANLYNYDQALLDAGIIKKSKFEKYAPGSRPTTGGGRAKAKTIGISRGKYGGARSAPTPSIKTAAGKKVAVRARSRVASNNTLKIKRG